MSVDPQVQALLPRRRDLRPQGQQAREDAPEPQRGGGEGAPPGHATPDRPGGGSRRRTAFGRTLPTRNLRLGSPPSARGVQPPPTRASEPASAGGGGRGERAPAGRQRGRGRETSRRRRETGNAGDASTLGEANSPRVKYSPGGRAGREGASAARARSGAQAQPLATGGRWRTRDPRRPRPRRGARVRARAKGTRGVGGCGEGRSDAALGRRSPLHPAWLSRKERGRTDSAWLD